MPPCGPGSTYHAVNTAGCRFRLLRLLRPGDQLPPSSCSLLQVTFLLLVPMDAPGRNAVLKLPRTPPPPLPLLCYFFALQVIKDCSSVLVLISPSPDHRFSEPSALLQLMMMIHTIPEIVCEKCYP